MAPTAARELVWNYLEHLQDESYIQEAVGAHGYDGLGFAATELIERFEAEAVGRSTLFVVDVSIGLFSPEITRRFRGAWTASRLFVALEKALVSSLLSVRRHAVHTFGKLSYPVHAPILHSTFLDRLETDPMLLNQLLFETRWLERAAEPDPGDEPHWNRLCRLVRASNPVSRWAVVPALVRATDRLEQAESAFRLLEDLSADAFTPIQREAGYWLERISTQRRRGDSKRERRSALRQLEKGRPVRFADLECAWLDEWDPSVQRVLEYLGP